MSTAKGASEMNLEAFVENEIRLAYRHGRNAGGASGSLATEDDIANAYTERIMNAIGRAIVGGSSIDEMARAKIALIQRGEEVSGVAMGKEILQQRWDGVTEGIADN